MQVKLNQIENGKWQADVVLPDGRDFHGIGNSPGDALIELGIFWIRQPEPQRNDIADIFRAVIEATHD